jgi:hypothetical protein
MLNRVVDEDCRTDYYSKSEGGSVKKNSKSGIISRRTRHWRPIRASTPHAGIWGAGDQTAANLLNGGVHLGAVWTRLRPWCPGIMDPCNAPEFLCLFSFGQRGDWAVRTSSGGRR